MNKVSFYTLLTFLMSISIFSQDINLDDMDIEDVMEIKVTSFDGSPKKWRKTPAAIHVISAEQIEKSSARNIPDLLRDVPGLHVAQIDNHTWAVGSRGFTRRYTNKLLILVDGRSIYTPLFSGVNWELSRMPLSDIDRIEIIRGPGGSLWGANAVNGVINIITKSAADTAGNYLKLGTGNIERAFGTYRFGEIIPENNLAYRFTLDGALHRHFKQTDGSPSSDDWKNLNLSTRVDWEPTDKDKILFSGGTYIVDTERAINTIIPGNSTLVVVEDDILSHGYNFLSRWDRTLDRSSSIFAQVYFDSYFRENPGYSEEVDTYDIELRYIYELNEMHKLTFGTGYRIVRDHFSGNDNIEFNPSSTQRDTFRLYAQDEISLIKDELTLILGTKYERNDHTGTEWQPGVRLIWTPNENHTFWGSIARAVRTPSRTDDDITNRIFFSGANEHNVVGDRGLESERLMAYEMGYRYTPTGRNYTFDLALFYNDYNHVNNIVTQSTQSVITDDEEGYTIGGEFFITYKPTDFWKLRASYSYLESKFANAVRLTGGMVPHIASLKSEYRLSDQISLYQNFYFRDHYTSSRFSYNDQFRMDLGLSWQINDSLKLSAWGINLLDPQTIEYADNESVSAELPRSFFIQLEWNF